MTELFPQLPEPRGPLKPLIESSVGPGIHEIDQAVPLGLLREGVDRTGSVGGASLPDEWTFRAADDGAIELCLLADNLLALTVFEVDGCVAATRASEAVSLKFPVVGGNEYRLRIVALASGPLSGYRLALTPCRTVAAEAPRRRVESATSQRLRTPVFA